MRLSDLDEIAYGGSALMDRQESQKTSEYEKIRHEVDDVFGLFESLDGHLSHSKESIAIAHLQRYIWAVLEDVDRSDFRYDAEDSSVLMTIGCIEAVRDALSFVRGEVSDD